MIVKAGFVAPHDGNKLASTAYRFSRSWALQLISRTDDFGSRPKRSVPFCCATPASGICLPI